MSVYPSIWSTYVIYLKKSKQHMISWPTEHPPSVHRRSLLLLHNYGSALSSVNVVTAQNIYAQLVSWSYHIVDNWYVLLYDHRWTIKLSVIKHLLICIRNLLSSEGLDRLLLFNSYLLKSELFSGSVALQCSILFWFIYLICLYH